MTKLSALGFLFTASILWSCNNNSAKTKLVRTWKLIEISGPNAYKIPDSIKKEMYGTRFMEFTDEGEMIATGGRSFMQRGNYELSKDGKILFTVIRGVPADTMLIDQLSKDKLVLTIKKDSVQLIMTPK